MPRWPVLSPQEFLATALGMLCFASAQAQPAPTSAATLESSDAIAAVSSPAREIVPLDFSIRTKKDKPVLDLTPSDLLLRDNGLDVELKALRLVKGTDGQDRPVTFVFDSLDVAPAQDARKLAEKLLSQFPRTGYTYAVMEIAGTLTSTSSGTMPGAQDTSFLFPTEFPPRHVASPGPPGLRLLQSYTARHELLRKAIGQATGEATQQPPAKKQANDPGAGTAEDPSRAQVLISAVEESQHPDDDAGNQSSLSSLLALVRSQGSIPGRKIVVYFSQGLPAGDSRNLIDPVIAEANRSEVSIVTIDLAANGIANHAMLAAMGPPSANGGDPAGALGALGMQQPLAALAAATGGVCLSAGMKSKDPLRQLRDELTDYYEAAYTPSLTTYDGKFHSLLVSARRADLVVRTRAGYFALPPESGSGVRLYEVPLLAILSGPQLPGEIAYRAQVLRLGEFSGKNTGELVVEVPISQLHVRADVDTNLSSVHAAIMMQVRNAKGDFLERFSEDVLRHAGTDVARSAGDDVGAPWDGDAIVMERSFAAEPGDYTLETAVQDELGNKSGAQRVKFTIAPQRPPILLSDLTLVRRISPLGSDARELDPMYYKGGRIIPDLADVLPPNTDHLSLFVLAHIAGDTQSRLTLRILRDGREVSTIPLTPAPPAAQPAESGLFRWFGTVKTSAFPPGHYEVQAMFSQNGQTATSSRSFVVEGSAAAADVSFTAVTGQADPDPDLPAERRLAESAAVHSSGFSISTPANPVPPPTPAEVQALVESARVRALAWTDSLPNFLCIETTWHSVYSRSNGSWQPRDTAVQLMRYIDHGEDRKLVELDGRRRQLPVQVEFAHSTGEFGGALRGIFEPAAKAQFTWQESDLLDGEPVQVLAYRVSRTTSSLDATDGANSAMVAFHGFVWIDTATHNIRRLTETAEDIPSDVSIRAASISIDYAWITIDHHEYMLPVHGAMSVLRPYHQPELNQFAFTDYHRFGAHVRMLPMQPSLAQSTP